MSETRTLKANQSFQSDVSMVDIPLHDKLNSGHGIIYEEQTEHIPPNPTLRPISNFDIQLLPLILNFLPPADLNKMLRVSWLFFKIAAPILYKRVKVTQLAGHNLTALLNTLQLSVTTSEGRRVTTIDYSTMVQSLTITHIVFDYPSALQSWTLVRDVISLLSPSLLSLSLDIADESFVDLPSVYTFLHPNIALPLLTSLSLTSKCIRVPQKLVLELLRATKVDGLQTIRLQRCLGDMDASTWFLIVERGGISLKNLILTPSVGPNILGWSEIHFKTGIRSIANRCTNMQRLDLSGHVFSIEDKSLEEFCYNMKSLEELYLPCMITDVHLSILSKCSSASTMTSLRVLGLTCMCVDGEMKEKKKGISCNRFTDNMLVTMLERLAAGKKVEILLPVYLIVVKTGKSVETTKWMSSCTDIRNVNGAFVYKMRVTLTIPTNRMATFF